MADLFAFEDGAAGLILDDGTIVRAIGDHTILIQNDGSFVPQAKSWKATLEEEGLYPVNGERLSSTPGKSNARGDGLPLSRIAAGGDRSQRSVFMPLASHFELSSISSWINQGFSFRGDWYINFCCSVGEALMAWGDVESQLAAFYVRLSKPHNPEDSFQHFNEIVSFNSRIDMTRKASRQQALTDDLTEEIAQLLEELSSLVPSRNALAHWRMIYRHHTEPRDCFALAKFRYGVGIEQEMSIDEVLRIKLSFFAMNDRLFAVWDRL